MDLNQWFEKGKSPDDYIDLLDKHKESFLHIYKHFTLPTDETFFQTIRKKNLRAIAISEVWCGHCMLNIPILLLLAEQTDMAVSILPRDQHLELMDHYLTNGKRIIPIIIFIDEDGHEVAKWGPMTEKMKKFVDKQKQTLPSKQDAQYKEKVKAFITSLSKSFSENRNIWNDSYASMKQTLMNIK